MTDTATTDIPTGYLWAITAEHQAITAADIAARTARLPAIRASGRPVSIDPVADWRDRANCVGIDPELFYPGPWDHAGRDEALSVCEGCVSRAQCLAWALEHGEEFGIWGGTTERDRRAMRRRLPRWARCHGCARRYVKRASGQRYCDSDCRGLSVKWRREVSANPSRRVSRRPVEVRGRAARPAASAVSVDAMRSAGGR